MGYRRPRAALLVFFESRPSKNKDALATVECSAVSFGFGKVGATFFHKLQVE